MKTCSHCKLSQPPTGFHRDATRADGLQSRCKACTKLTNALRYAADPAKNHEASRARYAAKGAEQNAARYAKYREQYLKRRDAELETARGRLYSVFAVARDRARKHGREFDITLDWLMLRWADNKGLCEVSGLPLTLDRDLAGDRRFQPFNPSLDRRDNARGYTPDNVRIVCVLVNLALNGFGDETFIRVCKAVAARNA